MFYTPTTFPITHPKILIINITQGRNLREGMGGGGGDTPQNTNHLDWQGESSGLTGQSKILNDRM
jgi:hypothetical protein